MRDNKNKSHRNRTGRGVANAVANPPAYTLEERQTVRQGLRILARIIAPPTWGVRQTGVAHPRPARRRQVNPASNPPGNRRPC